MSGQFVLPMKQSTCSWVSINCPVDLEWWPSLLVRQWRIAKWTTSSFFFWRIAQSMVIWWFEVQVCWWLTIIGMSARNTSIHIPKIGLTTNVANNQLTIGWLYNKGQCINNPPKKTACNTDTFTINFHSSPSRCERVLLPSQRSVRLKRRSLGVTGAVATNSSFDGDIKHKKTGLVNN